MGTLIMFWRKLACWSTPQVWLNDSKKCRFKQFFFFHFVALKRKFKWVLCLLWASIHLIRTHFLMHLETRTCGHCTCTYINGFNCDEHERAIYVWHFRMIRSHAILMHFKWTLASDKRTWISITRRSIPITNIYSYFRHFYDFICNWR